MSEQILLQGKILGIEPFLVSGGPRGPADEELFAGRSQWLTLISEVLPRALLAELGLSRVLLGASGGGPFSPVAARGARGGAPEVLSAAARAPAGTGGRTPQTRGGASEKLAGWWRG